MFLYETGPEATKTNKLKVFRNIIWLVVAINWLVSKQDNWFLKYGRGLSIYLIIIMGTKITTKNWYFCYTQLKV